MTRTARRYLVRLIDGGGGFEPANWLPSYQWGWAREWWLRTGLHPTLGNVLDSQRRSS